MNEQQSQGAETTELFKNSTQTIKNPRDLLIQGGVIDLESGTLTY